MPVFRTFKSNRDSSVYFLIVFVGVKRLYIRNIIYSVSQDSGDSIITANKGIILFENLLTGSRLCYLYRVTFQAKVAIQFLWVWSLLYSQTLYWGENLSDRSKHFAFCTLFIVCTYIL